MLVREHSADVSIHHVVCVVCVVVFSILLIVPCFGWRKIKVVLDFADSS